MICIPDIVKDRYASFLGDKIGLGYTRAVFTINLVS